MTPIEISIVITTYNVADYIVETVKSALSQEGMTIEVIVVDDASSDNGLQRLSTISDPRLKIIQLAENSGPSVARNTGFEAAQGTWIAVLDGDDRYLPDRLKRMLALGNAQNADIIVDNLSVYREEDAFEAPMFSPDHFAKLTPLTLAMFIREKASKRDHYTLGYLKPIFRTAFLKQHALAYIPQLRIGEDYRLMAEALACGAKCVVESTAGYRYTVRAGSISHRLSQHNLEQMMLADTEFLKRHSLNAAEQKAQEKRRFLHAEYLAYLKLVDALKQRKPLQAMAAIASQPTTIRHLWEPCQKRLRRLVARAR